MVRTDLERLIAGHVERHPGFGPEDLAKLLYQGVMGMDHLLADRERFVAALREEWIALDPASEENLVEPVHPSDLVARLNLRPAKAAGVPLVELAPLLADQPRRGGRLEDCLALWEEASALARAGRIPFQVEELELWGEALRSGAHPPGHSPAYRKLNRPAYRLVHNLLDPRIRRLLTRAGADLP